MIGRKIEKPLETQKQIDEFKAAAKWCEKNNADIKDMGDYYEVVGLPQPTLDEAKVAKIAMLKSERDRREVEPLQTTKGLFDYDDKSRDRLAIARQSLTDNPSIDSISWTTADNQRVAISVADFAEINSMAAYRSNQLHIKYNELKAAVNAAINVNEVNAIVWVD